MSSDNEELLTSWVLKNLDMKTSRTNPLVKRVRDSIEATIEETAAEVIAEMPEIKEAIRGQVRSLLEGIIADETYMDRAIFYGLGNALDRIWRDRKRADMAAKKAAMSAEERASLDVEDDDEDDEEIEP